MFREIGSNFWIAPDELIENRELSLPYSFGCTGSDYAWMSTGRSATRFVLKTIEERNSILNKVALLPPFTCHTVIEPFLDYGYEVHCLPISIKLDTTAEEIIQYQKITKASVVLVHRYYGFDTLPNINKAVEFLRNKGVVTIEDCTQSMYSCLSLSDADYNVGSIRKWCGAPDGGFAICRDGFFREKPVKEDVEMVAAKREAAILKYQYLFNNLGDKPTFKAKYREGEDLLDAQKSFFAIGRLSSVVQANLDIDLLKNRRQSNFRTLLNGLKRQHVSGCIFNDLPDVVVPLYFPLLVEERDSLQNYLANHDVYAPVVWPKANCCPEVSEIAEEIYNKILCIPIDQRYDTEDMNRVVNVISDFYGC